MSSKKVPTKRNQLEVIFKASTEGEMILGNFVPYAPEAEIIQINFPESFYFGIEPYESSFVVSYKRDGLYQIYGTIEDFQLKNIELPEETGYGTYELGDGYEIDTTCENPILKKYHLDGCPKCKGFCTSCGEEISRVVPKCDSLQKYNCDDGYETLCNDAENSPCSSAPISTQASLLRDIYDSKNHQVLDSFQDEVYLPIDQMFHCLNGKIDNIVEISPFLQTIRNTNNPNCIPQNQESLSKFDDLVSYYLH